ncbi:Uncharacterized protein conserved in bacteria (DUF2252) [Seminavis robusta]|uniref:Uncharacterized protein conserved in bacteria (DUF2252) n=1 Tax=Seminavis robusta TaxID=568900 RepID=A0A9N8EHX8_9STRA|nr:Uncharacterized protein conserved in bacteria (DUF2252) [Seminavis robusta]|eukprot:Sro1028_g233170.1 Uncharacterized protein conserved in bacteria (DUF2252) (636) ;mRNA; r:26049-28147
MHSPSSKNNPNRPSGESSLLLPHSHHRQEDADDTLGARAGSSRDDYRISSRWNVKIGLLLTSVCAVAFSTMVFLQSNRGALLTEEALEESSGSISNLLPPQDIAMMGGSKKKLLKRFKNHKKQKKDGTTYLSRFVSPAVKPRCSWVMDQFRKRDEGTPPLDLEQRYVAQSEDPNVFYRATAHIFWQDFAAGDWGGDFTRTFLLHNDPDSDDSKEEVDNDPKNIQRQDGALLTKRDVWTWVTGTKDCGVEHGDVVFGVNDFDEAAIFDFQVDVVRIAVSICSHAITNQLNEDEVDQALEIFFASYVHTVLDYEDNEDALLFELTPKTAQGELRKFLKKSQRKRSSKKQLTKFTTRDPVTQERHFIKGPVDVPHETTRLASLSPEMLAQVKQAFNVTHYGATMVKLGWAVPPWDDTYYRVLDVASRIGSGIGSFGVDRYYVLLKGRDGLLDDQGEDGSAVILDVKFQPPSAVSWVLDEEDTAWYKVKFPNEAARVVEAQRRLTSYTDPFTGWVMLRNLDPNSTSYGQDQPFSVRQRSPWKDSLDLDSLTDPDDFNQFVSQMAISTATSHVRGSVAKAPGDFKHVIGTVLGGSEHKRQEWGQVLAKVSRGYREQVLLDFECFRDYVQEHYASPDPSST